MREIGQGIYGFMFAQAVKVDAQDNIWVVDRGSDMVIKFDPSGRQVMDLSRKPESVTLEGRGPGGGGRGRGATGVGIAGDNFNRPTEVALDAAGNIFVSDGYANARVAKMDKDGKFLKSLGFEGRRTGAVRYAEFDRGGCGGECLCRGPGNKRIQVFDNDGNFKTQYANVGSPWAVCISPGAHQYLFSSNSNATDSMDNGEIYKMELDGKVLGKFGKAGKGLKEFGTVNQIDCRNPNGLFVAEITNWRVQKLNLH